MASKFLRKLAALLDLHVHDKPNPWGKSAAAGWLDGFPVLIGEATFGDNYQAMALLFRYRQDGLQHPATDVVNSVCRSPALNAAMRRAELAKDDQKLVRTTRDGLILTWPCYLRKPKPERVAAAARAVTEALKSQATPLGSECERCGASGADLLTSHLSMALLCPACVRGAVDKYGRAMADYRRRPYSKGLATLAGIATMLVMAATWGLLIDLTHRIFGAIAILAGLAITTAVIKAAGKVTWYGRVLASALTVLSGLLGDFFGQVLALREQLGHWPSAATLELLSRRFLGVEFSRSGDGPLSVFLGLVTVACVVAMMPMPRRALEFNAVGPGRQPPSAP